MITMLIKNKILLKKDHILKLKNSKQIKNIIYNNIPKLKFSITKLGNKNKIMEIRMKKLQTKM